MFYWNQRSQSIAQIGAHYTQVAHKKFSQLFMLLSSKVLKWSVKKITLTLYLVFQAKPLNRSGELFIQKYPKLRVRLVDGSGLATAVVLKSIPLGTKKVFLSGSTSKVAHATAMALCEKGVQVHLSFCQSICLIGCCYYNMVFFNFPKQFTNIILCR